MTRDDFQRVLERAAAGWNDGNAAAVADCFAEDVDYGDPVRYRFTRREALLPFFAPPPGGHRVEWHTIVWDDAAQTGVVEYTYEGHHRYHGAAVAELDGDGRIRRWREWQHLDDRRDWASMLAGPPNAGSTVSAIDHVQLGIPEGGEEVARAFYGELLGLEEVPKPPELSGRGGAWFAGPGVSIHLGIQPDFRPATKAHPAFVVADLVGLRVRLASAGVAIVEDDSGLPVERCYVADPFGNRIELVERPSRSSAVVDNPASRP